VAVPGTGYITEELWAMSRSTLKNTQKCVATRANQRDRVLVVGHDNKVYQRLWTTNSLGQYAWRWIANGNALGEEVNKIMSYTIYFSIGIMYISRKYAPFCSHHTNTF